MTPGHPPAMSQLKKNRYVNPTPPPSGCPTMCEYFKLRGVDFRAVILQSGGMTVSK